jgi:MSHA biogenesis protein MshJ
MKLSELSAKYEILSHREKVLIILTSTLFFCAIMFLLFIEPQYKTLQKSQQQYQANINLTSKVADQNMQLEKSLSLDLEDSVAKAVSELSSERDELQSQLDLQSISVLSASELTHYLTKILNSASLIKIESFQVNAQPFNDAQESLDIDDIFLIKQNITLNIQANRVSLMLYMQFLESLPISVFWDSLEYQTLRDEQVSLIVRFHLFSAKE